MTMHAPTDLSRFVQPFYLDMMRTNAAEGGATHLAALRGLAREVTDDIVIDLLRDPWRSTVMGAWFSMTRDSPAVRREVGRALAMSDGTLTSPPLTVAAVVLEGESAAPLLWAHRRLDQAHSFGGTQFIDAALTHVTGTSADPDLADTERAVFEGMLRLALQLRYPRGT
jgi:hypothetical protein